MPLQPLTPELIQKNVESKVWLDKPLYAVIDGHAEATPDKLAVADQHERLTYAELVERSSQLARGLLQQGLSEGEVVLVQCPNEVLFAVAFLACNRAGLCFAPISSMWRGKEMRHLLTLTKARYALLPAKTSEFDYLATAKSMRAELTDLEGLVDCGNNGDGDIDLSDLMISGSEPVCKKPDPNVPYYCMPTSGTTDLPRMPRWTDNNLWYFLGEYLEAVEFEPTYTSVAVAPINLGSIGFVKGVLAPLLKGATSIILEKWSPRAALDLIVSEKATGLVAIPTQIVMMLELGESSYPAVRYITNAGAPISPERAIEAEQKFSCKIQAVYGATDGGVACMTKVTDADDKRLYSVGKPLKKNELRLLDDNQSDVSAGESGEILWRSPTKSFGYLNEPERTENTFWADSWYRSGDVGELDADGYLRIVGRVKDMIIRGGQNISPREIEEAMVRHPAISDAAAVGYPDSVFGERVCACLVMANGQEISIEELQEHLKGEELVKYKWPERIEYFDELPRTAAQKISKVELKDIIVARIEESA